MAPLTRAALAELSADVTAPAYDLDAITAGIVHFGVGAFHRAHEAMFVDRLLASGHTDWAICGVGLMPFDLGVRDALKEQDNLYTLVTKAPDGTSEARVIGSLVQYLYAPDAPEAVLSKLVSPTTRIVSLTITEGGYSVNDATGKFEPHDEATLADIAQFGSSAPRSVLGYIVAALRARRDASIAPFTLMSCDNIQGNGAIARIAVLGFAASVDHELATWIADNVAFPNSMVDRITPATTPETRAAIEAEFGVADAWPVRSESFAQWVLEDHFTMGRPAFEAVGVQMVADVEPYELMKLRLLNASHQAMSYLGILSGATYVHEVCTDPLFIRFLLDYMHHEAIPTLRPVPGIDLLTYCNELISRFSSEAILDTLARQVVDGSERIPKFLLPVIREQLARGGEISRSALVLAAWSLFLEGFTEDGRATPVQDRRLAELREAVAAERDVPGSFLNYRPVFGDLGENSTLRTAFVSARESLVAVGSREAVARLAT